MRHSKEVEKKIKVVKKRNVGVVGEEEGRRGPAKCSLFSSPLFSQRERSEQLYFVWGRLKWCKKGKVYFYFFT